MGTVSSNGGASSRSAWADPSASPGAPLHGAKGLAFLKAHGTGNDFVVVIDRDDTVVLSPGTVRALCDRHTGVGADGLIRIATSPHPGAVFMDYRNADGSQVEMCGNGVRVVAKVAADFGLVDASDNIALVDTRAGLRPVQVRLGPDGTVETVTVDMGPPEFIARPELSVEHQGSTFHLTAVSMGNPHAVARVASTRQAPVSALGAMLQDHPAFPEQVNVGFVQLAGDDQVALRVYERGVGETLACGTGACAAVAVLQREQVVGDVVDVNVLGGRLVVERRDDGHLLMTGPAVVVASGVISEDWLASVGHVGAFGTAQVTETP